jgi:hypothetical protein
MLDIALAAAECAGPTPQPVTSSRTDCDASILTAGALGLRYVRSA